MAGEDEQGKGKAQAGGEGPRKLDRREVLMGLSTVPALGLFGYAWNKQRQYQQARMEAASAPLVAPAGEIGADGLRRPDVPANPRALSCRQVVVEAVAFFEDESADGIRFADSAG